MSTHGDKLLHIYAVATGGNADAFAFLCAWHAWCHRIDDFVDESHAKEEVVDLCADGVVLCSSAFYRRHAEALGPVIACVAEKYRSSLFAKQPMADALRIAGNDIVLVVAYLCGGRALMRTVSEALWPVVLATQLEG